MMYFISFPEFIVRNEAAFTWLQCQDSAFFEMAGPPQKNSLMSNIRYIEEGDLQGDYVGSFLQAKMAL